MKLRFDKDELFKGLQRLQGIVERKTTMPILSHFLLKANPAVSSTTASITATDLEIVLQEPVLAEIIEGGSACIPAKKLFEIVRELDDDIALETEGAGKIKIEAGLSSFKLMCLDEEDFPSLPEIEDAKHFTIQTVALKKMLEKTIYATGESDTRYAMNGLLLHLDPPESSSKDVELKMIGTDGHRLAIISAMMSPKDEPESVMPMGEEIKYILPRKAAMELKNILPEKTTVKSEASDNDEASAQEAVSYSTTIGFGKNHVFFTIPDVRLIEMGNTDSVITLTSRLIDGIYPDYKQVVPSIGDNVASIEKDRLYKALRRVSVMSRERTSSVKFAFHNNQLILKSSNPDIGGEAKDEIVLNYQGDPISTGFNARFLMEALQAMEGASVNFYLRDPLSPALLKEQPDSTYKCVVMPMRV